MKINSNISKISIYLFFIFTFISFNSIRIYAIETIFVTNEYSEFLVKKMYGVNNDINILNVNQNILFTPIVPTNLNSFPNKNVIYIFNKEKFDYIKTQNENNSNNIENDFQINLSELLDKKNIILNPKKSTSQSQKKIDSLSNIITKKDIKNPKIIKSNNDNKIKNENINPNYWLSIDATINIIDSLNTKISILDSNTNSSIVNNSELIKKRLNLLKKEIEKYSQLRKSYLLKSNFNNKLILSINGTADYYLSNIGINYSKYDIEFEVEKDKIESKENIKENNKQNNEINKFNESKPDSKKVVKDSVNNKLVIPNQINNSNINTNSGKFKTYLNSNKPEVIIYFTENSKSDSKLINLIENISYDLKIQFKIIDLNDYKMENENNYNRGFDYFDFMKWLALKV